MLMQSIIKLTKKMNKWKINKLKMNKKINQKNQENQKKIKNN